MNIFYLENRFFSIINYEILGEIGIGESAIVYRGFNFKNKIEVSIKRLF
jgi:hypothetical protein